MKTSFVCSGCKTTTEISDHYTRLRVPFDGLCGRCREEKSRKEFHDSFGNTTEEKVTAIIDRLFKQQNSPVYYR